MRDYIDVTGKTEDEAIRKGLDQLGVEREDVSVEILERAKAGFLGFGSAPAKVRISYGEEKEEPKPVQVPAESTPPAETARPCRKEDAAPAEQRERKGDKKSDGQGRKAGRGSQRRERSAKKGERDAAKEPVPESAAPVNNAEAVGGESVPEGKASEDGAKNRKPFPRKGGPKQEPGEARSVPVDSPAPEGPAPLPSEEADDEKAQAIRTFLTGLLQHMGHQAVVKVYLPESGRYKVLLEGTGLGALIGRRGETLDAMQQLTSYAVNRAGGPRARIQLDAEGYREKREQSLQRLAKKNAAKVVKSRRSFTLEPMNAYERHVIHTALQDFPGVTTYSTGVDPNRRVIIAVDRERN